MPDVIDLISSTPPAPPTQRPSNSRAAPTAATAANSSPRQPPSQFTFSDDIDNIFAYDGFHDKPAKKRRVSDELKPRQHGVSGCDRSRSPGASKSLFRFSDDEDEGFGLPPALGSSSNKNTTQKGSTMSKNVEESDPIVFTSSAPTGEPESAKKGPVQQRAEFQRTNTITIDSDEDDDNGITGNRRGAVVERRDEIVDFSDQLKPLPDMDELMEFAEDFHEESNPTSGPLFSSRTANLLASLESGPGRGTGTTTKKTSTTAGRLRKGKDTTTHEDLSDDLVDPPQPKRKTTNSQTSEDKDAKARNREAAKAERENAKQLEKERKAKLKEEKAKGKQLAADLAQVNKSKVDKKESTPEMIIDIDSSLEESSVGNQAVEFMRRLGVEYTFFPSSILGIVKWRRKVKATFNEALGYWEPCALHVKPEKHVLCLLTAQDFADMVIAPVDSGESLKRHVLKIKETYSGCKPIYLIEGLTAWMRKNHNARNRAYQAEVRRQLTAQPNDNNNNNTTTSNRRTKKPETTPTIDDDTIEDALLNLQVTHSCLIHHTAAAPESAEWLKAFTEHVSTIPYRLELIHGNDSAFCMDVGQVKTGEDKKDTFVKMLQEVNRVTASMAYGIVEQYPSVVDLVDGMKEGGSGLLEDVRKSANKNGTLTEARIGPAVSRRLYKVFMGLDPSSTDI